jgi:hypothetical protein
MLVDTLACIVLFLLMFMSIFFDLGCQAKVRGFKSCEWPLNIAEKMLKCMITSYPLHCTADYMLIFCEPSVEQFQI